MTFFSRTRAILETVFDDAPLAEACLACQASLAAFVDAELDGQPAAERFPAVAGHLATCKTCQQDYAELRALLAMERDGQFEQPPGAEAEPVFDRIASLSVEPQAEPAPGARSTPSAARQLPEPLRRPWRLEAAKRLVIEFSADLLRALQPSPLQPATLKSGAAPTVSYTLAGEVDDLNVAIHVEPSRQDPHLATVEVDVEIPSRGGWPHLAGSAVTLRRNEDVLDEQETDAFGKAVFEDVAVDDLPQLAFEIAPV